MRRGHELQKPPVNIIDMDLLKPYVDELENPALPGASFQWLGRSRALVKADLRPDQLLLFQISYHAGWHALVNGIDLPLKKDPMGMMLLNPQCSGACTVDLYFDGGFEAKAARYASFLAFLVGLVWIVVERLRARRA